MLRLFFLINDNHLKVRKVLPGEEFLANCTTKNGTQFAITRDEKFMMEWSTLLPTLLPVEAKALLELVGNRFPFAKGYQALKNLCPKFVFQDQALEWVFFGGSFNPWHEGHQACLNLLPQEKTCFIIPDRNPLKDVRQTEPVATLLEFSSLIQYKIRQYLAPTFLLSPDKNPTVDWIESLHQRYPQKKLSLLLGHDSFASLDKWIRSGDLLNLLSTIYVVSRLEADQERERQIIHIKKIAPGIEIDFLGRHEFEHISSTDIRASRPI